MRYVLKVRPASTNPDELMHAGIKGMRWGVRRYQNEDGTLTDAGKKRYARDTKDLSEDKKSKYEANPNKWVNEDLNATKKVADETVGVANTLKNANAASMRKPPKIKKMDLSSMTDQQMRSEINRALLEKQYNEIFAPRKSTRGREIADSILSTAGTIVAIGGGAVGIAVGIRELRGKR